VSDAVPGRDNSSTPSPGSSAVRRSPASPLGRGEAKAGWLTVSGGRRVRRGVGVPPPLPHRVGERVGVRGRGVAPAVGLLLLALPASVHAQLGDVQVKATADRATIRLSDPVRVTLTVIGRAPLRIDLPDPLLSPESDLAWRIRPAGPPEVQPLDGGREQWSQTYRLDPYATGEVGLEFAPIRVNGQDVKPAPLSVRVLTDVTEAKPDAARPVTGIEELPPAPPDDPGAVGWALVTGAAAVLAAAVLAALRRRWRARAKPLPPAEWAVARLDRLGGELAAGRVSGGVLADRVAAVLRGFVERRYGLPATRLTTGELILEVERAGWPAEPAAALRAILDRCDRAKFAGQVPDPAACGELVTGAREWVTAQAPPAPVAAEAGSYMTPAK
jgi:hypothetical protein